MCGIVGYVGKKNCIPILINGLKNLEYRGYDSAGIAFLNDNQIKIIKKQGRLMNLEKEIDNKYYSNLGIGHTRWATHGVANEINAHPHHVGDITLIHNGIIENYEGLRDELINHGYQIDTENDTKIACAYIDYLYKNNHDMLKTLSMLKEKFKGSYALGILVNGSDKLYAIRKDSPLIVGVSNDGNYIASDVFAILNETNKYIVLDNNEVVILDNKVNVYNDGVLVDKEVLTFNHKANEITKNGYSHFMLKEIHEQDNLSKKLIDMYLENKDTIINKMPCFDKYDKIDIVACGSAYHAGMIGKSLIEEYGDIPVSVNLASEYRYKKLFLNDKTLVIAISQSGETADTLASVNIAKQNHADTLGIVNVVGSSIARVCDNVLYTNAGPEIAVATTKAYSMQVLMLSLIALNIGISKNLIDKVKLDYIINNYRLLPSKINEVINKNYSDIAKQIYNKNDIFFIGRNVDYALAMEGSLKLKEISYLHAESYAAGELKHGTISLIEKGTPVIAIVTDDKIYEKTISNIKEVKARGANVILITNDKLDVNGDFYDSKIVVNNLHNLVNSLITIVPLQLIAYEVAKMKNLDIDKPRNLAKSVTVE
ncbi:MAG: glutamine--fructose-6-phosphate transaminase (isomerizing) [Bacilli bacterium]